MQQAGYGPLRLTDGVTCLGLGESDFAIRFTPDGVGREGLSSIPWSDISRIDAEFSMARIPRFLEFAANLLNVGVAAGPSVMTQESVLSVSLKSGKRVSWSFAVPPSGSKGDWNRKNIKILFEELSSLGRLSLLGSSVAAERLLVQLDSVRPLLPWRRRRQIADIIAQIKER